MEKVKVFLVDDHDILMDGIEAILKDADDIVVVGKANSVEMAEQYIKVKQPDVVLTDISMGKKSGLDLTKFLQHHYPKIKVVILSMHDDYFNMSTLIKAGASGYLLKNVKNEELHKAIAKVMNNETYIQQSIASKFVNGYVKDSQTEKINNLSPREIEIIRLIVAENTTIEISKRLFISEHTVETHRKNIWRKTGAKSIIGLINYAKEHQLIG
ncbi:response regulator transcription factor [Pedobacter frigiditerrae]|uniref:Response regulator transcription factor n=1 Tax=Pedobacter frigiditerrae TaxID=2530452 RepID=A0A4V2MJI4_9SPHI|nr:response regulator transcription factor [Pedobacter frigiditerrae]TCC94416.1 response regulator transcription factor [Pedobacter frigiditerrae]